MRKRQLYSAIVFLVSTYQSTADAGLISIDSTLFFSEAQSGNTGSVATFTGMSIPTNVTLPISHGSSSSITQIVFSETAGQTILDFGLEHVRDPINFSYGDTHGRAVFTLNQNTTYDLSGFYNVENVNSSESGIVFLQAGLLDLTNNSTIVAISQQSRNTSNESFTLLGGGGDFQNSSTGSLQGNLTAGTQYRFFFTAFIQTFPNTDGGASAVGNVTLKIGPDPTPVPEPPSLALLGIGVAGIFCVGYRRRQALLASQAA